MQSKQIIGVLLIGVGLFVASLTVGHALYYAGDVGTVSVVTPNITEAQTVTTGASADLSNTSAQNAVAPAPAPKNPRWPSRLIIPNISVNANVQYVGINAKGGMGTPAGFSDVAWYKGGTIPGDTGSAVIDGHVDNGLGLSGVFKHLEDVHIGDDVYVVQNDGDKLHFRVIDVQLYPYDDAPSDAIFNRTDAAHLNLITCSGDWVGSEKTYNKRLVIYTELVK